MELRIRVMSKRRTKKEFEDYNDYKDRAFGLKWGTAFALSELTQVIGKAKASALKEVKELPLMTRDEIDKVLQLAFLKSKEISIQLNHRDENGNLLDNLVGPFEGMADEEYLYLGDASVSWDSIRNVSTL